MNQLEQLMPVEVDRLSKQMIKAVDQRIDNIKAAKELLPASFQMDGSIVIRDYYFDTIISALNHIVSNMVRGGHYDQIKNSIRNLRTSINHSGKHAIATQKGKLELLNIIKLLKPSTHFNNLSQTINIVIHLISQCAVLNGEAYKNYHFLMQRFNRTHHVYEKRSH